MSYDIIGDVHGHADALTALLRKMGYRKHAFVWRHPDRQAIFVGDFIDRGPRQLEAVGIVRSMVEAGTAMAVMGNHEFNAIAWHTPNREHPGEFLRPHSEKNQHQHAAFLKVTTDAPALHKSILDWFLTLPLWLDLPGLRVVHACWHPKYMAHLEPMLQPGNRLDLGLVEAASRRGSTTFDAVEAILKGPEVTLPNGMRFPQGGNMRSNARTRWWDRGAITFRQSAIVDAGTRHRLPDTPIPEDVRFGYDGDKPVFVGHYWMTGQPQLLTPLVACTDYSAGKGDPLVAYQWDGERDLDPGNFVSAR